MKTIALVLVFAAAAHAAPDSSFTWQGVTTKNPQFSWVDDTHVALGTAVIPLSAVPAILRSRIPAKVVGERMNCSVLQVLPDGLLMRSSVQDGEPWLLRGHPQQATLVDGAHVTCTATPEGRYTYSAVSGGTKTIAAWRWSAHFSASPPPATGTALDRR